MKFLDDMRTTLVVQALEQSDPGEVVLLDEDKREVGVTAGAPLAKNLSTREENTFLAERAELLGLRASTRHPEETRWVSTRPESPPIQLAGNRALRDRSCDRLPHQ